MAIYVNNLGSGELPVTLNNPQEGESLVWDEASGAFINAPSSTSTEVIQDTVADMLEVDPAGSNLSLRLVSNYDDATGKLTFNVVTDGGSSGGNLSGIAVKENGATRGVATTLDFIGGSVAINNGTATIQGLMDHIRIYDNGVNQGDVQNFNFENLTVSLDGDIVTVAGPDLSIFASKSYVDDAIANIDNGGGGSYTLPTASGSTLGGIKLGSGLSIDGNGVVSVTGGGSSYTLPVASTLTLGGPLGTQ